MDTVALLEFDIKVPPLLFTHLFTYNFTHHFRHHFTHNFRLFLTKNCPTTAQSAQMAILWKILFLNDSEIYQSLNILYLVLNVSTNHLKRFQVSIVNIFRNNWNLFQFLIWCWTFWLSFFSIFYWCFHKCTFVRILHNWFVKYFCKKYIIYVSIHLLTGINFFVIWYFFIELLHYWIII